MVKKKTKCSMILLAGGKGSRMNNATPKTFLPLGEKPILWYSLQTIEKSDLVQDCVVVCSGEMTPILREHILDDYGFTKWLGIAEAGRERYESVLNGIRLLSELRGSCEQGEGAPEVILIHDGARPFLTEKMIADCIEAAEKDGACVLAVPSKETVKISDEDGFVVSTPDRKSVWAIQTPQGFRRGLITECYEKLGEMIDAADRGEGMLPAVTDDASVVELFSDVKVRLVMGDYRNLKITTPEDMDAARAFLK